MRENLETTIQSSLQISAEQFLAERQGKTVDEIYSDMAAAGISTTKPTVYNFLGRHKFKLADHIKNNDVNKNWPPAKSEYEATIHKENESRAIARIAKKYKVTSEQSKNVYNIYFNQGSNFRQPVYVLRVLQGISERTSVGIGSLLPEYFDRKNGATYQESFIYKIYLGMTEDCSPSSALKLMLAASKENPNELSEPIIIEEDFEKDKVIFSRGTPSKFEYVSPHRNGKSGKN
jgi:hypothetical protein